MDKVSELMVLIAALALAWVGVSASVAAEDEGCVTCHTGPTALNTLLSEKVPDHLKIWDMVNTIPTYCGRCHVKDTELALMNVIHPRHEGVDCGDCHVVDENHVPTAIKTGVRNW